MKVSMIPNDDIVTIHASQNDGDNRVWEFEPYTNDGVIDTLGSQTIYPVYVGGTEQILPANESVPVTAPILADIEYPDELRTDQEFLYRQTPSVLDGNAKIKTIYGNSIVWNQLVQNGNFADGTNGWAKTSTATWSVSNNKLTFKAGAQYNNMSQVVSDNLGGHTILAKCKAKSYTNTSTMLKIRLFTAISPASFADRNTALSTTEQEYSVIINVASDIVRVSVFFQDSNASGWGNIEISNVQLFDLTQMGYDTLTAQQFQSLFSLPYYQFTTGTLLSFNGSDIKTTGKNLLSGVEDGTMGVDGLIIDSSIRLRTNRIFYITPGTYTISASTNKSGKTLQVAYQYWLTNARDGTNTRLFDSGWQNLPKTITITEGSYFSFVLHYTDNSDISANDITPQIEFGSTATSYEPYIEHTTSLPVLGRFPTGMKSVGTVYDELSDSKMVTRIGSLDLGEQNWAYANNNIFYVNGFNIANTDIKDNYNQLCALYTTVASNGAMQATDKSIYIHGTGFNIHDSAFTSASALKTYLSGIMLIYEMKTPTEQDFITMSLVTQNTEIPLEVQDDKIICKCSELITQTPGFHDCKLKLTDSDGTIYSQKIKLHVERKP